MPVLPQSDLQMIEWFEERLASWAGDPAAIGLTPDQTSSLLTLTSTARAAYQAAQQSRNDAKTKTVAFHNGSGDLRGFGADLIKTIKAYAEASDDPNVYVLAEVPPPADPEPLGAPGQPTNITTTLNSAGHLHLKWKADNATASTGAYFMVHRKLAGENGFTLAGGASGKEFIDTKIPLGTATATYILYAHRGSFVSVPSNQVTVQFGVNIPGPGEEASGENNLGLAA